MLPDTKLGRWGLYFHMSDLLAPLMKLIERVGMIVTASWDTISQSLLIRYIIIDRFSARTDIQLCA